MTQHYCNNSSSWCFGDDLEHSKLTNKNCLVFVDSEQMRDVEFLIPKHFICRGKIKFNRDEIYARARMRLGDPTRIPSFTLGLILQLRLRKQNRKIAHATFANVANVQKDISFKRNQLKPKPFAILSSKTYMKNEKEGLISSTYDDINYDNDDNDDDADIIELACIERIQTTPSGRCALLSLRLVKE